MSGIWFHHMRAFLRLRCTLEELKAPSTTHLGHRQFPAGMLVDAYEDYLLSRADIHQCLSHLVGRISVCDCRLREAPCHARILKEWVDRIFQSEEEQELFVCQQCDEEDEEEMMPDDRSGTSRTQDFEWKPASEVAGRVQQVNESLRGSPSSVSMYIPEWLQFAIHIRSFGTQIALEVFAGTCIISSLFVEWGIPCGPPFEILIFPWMDLLNPSFLCLLVGLVLEGRFWFLWLAPPCSTFSMACNRFIETMLRNIAYLEGLPSLTGVRLEKVRIGNALRDVALTLARAQASVGETLGLEQPATSLMLETEGFKAMEKETGAVRGLRDQCVDGAPWKKTTAVISNDANFLEMERRCDISHSHILLQGRNDAGISWTEIASSYWPQFAHEATAESRCE